MVASSKSDVANDQIDEYDTDTVTDVDLREHSKVHVRPACRTRSRRAILPLILVPCLTLIILCSNCKAGGAHSL